MNASVFLDLCESSGISFFTGVPDSFLKGLCDELFFRYGTSGPKHTVAHNEGGAVGLCAGHYLATGRPALCYMQNSGLGNAVNPLASLMDRKVYSIPCLLVVGWRGEPGVSDEPQHITQGAVTLGQLSLLDIPYEILSTDTTDDQLREMFSRFVSILNEGRVAALVARKGAFVSDSRPDYGNNFSMTREEAAGIILEHSASSDIFVSTTGKLSREIFELREKNGQGHEKDFLTVGSMGHASMIAMQIARERPDRRVWCLDGDGAMLMHLGASVLIGMTARENLIHVVINNGAHETVGGMPVCSGKMDICALGRAAHYSVVLSADSPDTLAIALNQAEAVSGPVLIQVCCACGARKDLGRPTTTPVQNRDALMKHIRG